MVLELLIMDMENYKIRSLSHTTERKKSISGGIKI